MTRSKIVTIVEMIIILVIVDNLTLVIPALNTFPEIQKLGVEIIVAVILVWIAETVRKSFSKTQ